jgi:hypothetical protein
MTILNIFVRSDRALIGMDTMVVNTESGERSEASKFGLLAESNVFIGWRGDRVTGAIVYAECMAARSYVDFDALAPEMPRLILETLKVRQDQRIAQGAPPEVLVSPHCHSLQLAMVGWSKQENQMRGTLYSKMADQEDVQVEAIPSAGIIAPGDLVDPSLREPVSSISAMERISKLQYRAAIRSSDVLGGGFGGVLLLVELERDQARIRRRRIFD